MKLLSKLGHFGCATKGSSGPDMADHTKGFQVNLRDQLTLGAVSRACFMTYARQICQCLGCIASQGSCYIVYAV